MIWVICPRGFATYPLTFPGFDIALFQVQPTPFLATRAFTKLDNLRLINLHHISSESRPGVANMAFTRFQRTDDSRENKLDLSAAQAARSGNILLIRSRKFTVTIWWRNFFFKDTKLPIFPTLFGPILKLWGVARN